MEKYQHMEVGKVLRKLRNERMATQKEVAQSLNMDKGTYCNTETGKRDMGLRELFSIANYYGLKATALLEMIQATPADLSEVKKLRLKIDELLQQNAYLKEQIRAELNNN